MLRKLTLENGAQTTSLTFRTTEKSLRAGSRSFTFGLLHCPTGYLLNWDLTWEALYPKRTRCRGANWIRVVAILVRVSHKPTPGPRTVYLASSSSPQDLVDSLNVGIFPSKHLKTRNIFRCGASSLGYVLCFVFPKGLRFTMFGNSGSISF
jgi:hypothetical protein